MNLFALGLLAILVVINGFSPSPEFKAIRGIDVIAARDGLPKDVTKLIIENDPNESILICFRSFG